jgi:lipoprotein Spr/probable lipoprotein NlpC
MKRINFYVALTLLAFFFASMPGAYARHKAVRHHHTSKHHRHHYRYAYNSKIRRPNLANMPEMPEVLENNCDFLCAYSGVLGVNLDSSCNPQFVQTITSWLGTPYRHAGYSKQGIDCSGFVSRIYKDVYNIDLTHSSSSMIFQMKTIVKKDELKEGDILFFRIHGRRISHVGIYIGDNKFIHASPERGIVVDDLREPYYMHSYYTAGRPDACLALR